jgi:proline racemase
MRWKRTLQLVDVHCAGEIGRVVTAGILDIPGVTMAAKLHHINTVDDSLRRLLCSEPRGGPAGSVVLLTPATRPEADTGMIILQPDQAHAMSGSNAMCAVTALLETGMVEMIEPETTVTIDTAAGLVSAIASCKDGKVTQVSLDMPPAFVAEKSATVLTEKWGEITYDLCYGGIFYGLVDVKQIGLTISPENARDLATYGVILRDLIADDLAGKGVEIIHPETPEINGIAYVMFCADEPDGAIRTCTTLKPGRVDRSPCGTGSNASMAVRYAEGNVVQGDVLRSRSIIGGEFTAEFLGTQPVGPYEATKSRISGQCWIYGISQIGLDPTDPFPLGFTLSDTWGA